MPNDAQISLQACLSTLEKLQNGSEDAVFSTVYKDHLNLLQSLKTLLSNKVEVSPTDADRVLGICLKYITDVRCVLDVFSVISELIDIDKDNPHVDFLPFGLALLKFLNTKCLEDNTSKLRILSFQLLMKHPQHTLLILIRHHSPNIIQTFQPIVEIKQAEDLPSKIESFKLLTMLEWLPPCEKRLFVEAGISLWLSGVIPAMVEIIVSAEDANKIDACLTSTEILTNELVQLDYYENPHWKSLLERITNPKMFPASIMGLLQEDKDNWHRIWIVLIKLLKSQVTQCCRPFTSPINSMLPVVEFAFKKESVQRVRAFACWYELVESFYNETGNCLKKRIKLLMIPLKLFNTKTEETAAAKFHTWWHFILKFRLKIKHDNIDIILSFLYFMFGKQQGIIITHATQYSDNLRKRCIEAFEEIMNLKQLDDNIISTKILLDHWKVFTYALKSCLRAVAQSYTDDTKKKIQSIWISFVMRLAAMPENTVRRDMFDDLVIIVSDLILENQNLGNECLMEILVDDITLPLWRDKKLKTLTKSRSQSYRPMHRIVKLITDDQFDNYFKRFNSEDLTRLLQPLVNTVLEESISEPQYIIWLLDELLVTKGTMVMWTALAQASKESKLSMEAFNKILLWPFKTVNISFEVKEAAEAWYTLYNVIHDNLEETDFYNEISKVLKRPVEDSKASNYFVLFALNGVLKHKPDEAKMEKLEALTYEMNDYNDFEQLLTPLVNSIVFMINNSTDENLGQITINCVENILKGLKSETEAISSKSPIQNRAVLSDTITSTLKTYLEKCPYQSIKNQVKSILYLYDTKTESPKMVSESQKKLNESSEVTPFSGWGIPPKEFVSPKMKKLKTSIKEASIVSKVVENGEEYVVIKSNWKFNPKNLTENQKEKLQRKKADIPALYGDQSQSQEFKLTSWKTDSQDTSLSSSKSDTCNNVADNLKKITNSNIIPKIMENILDFDKHSKLKNDAKVSPIAKAKTPKAVKLSTPGDTKSPRMALKDRVCRNVRNLIGNSSPLPQDKVTDKQENNILQNVSRSPLSHPETVCIESPAKNAESNDKKKNEMKPSNNDIITTDKQENRSPVTSPPIKKNISSTQRIDEIIRLACTPELNRQKEIVNLPLPTPQTSYERPTRLKKTPKKFDHTIVLPLKRRRYSKNYSQDLLESCAESEIAQIHKPNDKMDVIDANSPQKVPSDEADTNEDANKTPTTTNDNIIIEGVKSCAASDDKSRKDEKATLISPKTSINKPNAKSPVKSSIGEVPSILSNASEGVDNDAAQNETYDVKDKPNEKATLCKQNKLQKTSIKKVGAQHDLLTDHMETPNISQKKCRKSNVQKEISANDENAALNPVTADKDLYKAKCNLLNDTDKNAEMVEVVSINKTKNDSDTSQLPVSKSQELQKTSKKVSAQHDVIPDLKDTPNISRKKIRKYKLQKQISANDENAAGNTPVTADKNLCKPKCVFLNDTDKNAEMVEVVSINKTKKDSDTSQLPLSKSQELQKTSNKVGALHDVIPDHMDTPNISQRKRKKSKIQKEISANDENAEGNTPVTADKDLYKTKCVFLNDTDLKDTPNISRKKIRKYKLQKQISANDENAAGNTPVTADKNLCKPKCVFLNDTDKNAEMVEVVSINKTKNDSDTSQLPLSKSQELQKTSKKVGAQHDVIPDPKDTPNISMRKFRKSKLRKQISANYENAAGNTPVTADKDLYQAKCNLLNDTDKNAEMVEVVSINKTKNDSDTGQLPLSKSQELQKTSEVGAQHDVIPDLKDTPNISQKKFRKYKLQKQICANDENAAGKTPVTADKDLCKSKCVFLNDTDKNAEMVEVISTSINKTNKDSDTSQLPLSAVKTNEASQDKLIQKKAYDIEAENNKDVGNRLNTPKTQKTKKSRIENELAIDMVEGHPFLKIQSAKRLTRKSLMEVNNGSKTITLVNKLNKSKLKLTPKTHSPSVNSTIIVEDSQDTAQSYSPQNIKDELQCSEDVIESSQDSTMTTISTKAKMRTPKRIPIVALEIITVPITPTQDLLQDCEIVDRTDKENHESTDIVLPQNKSVESDKNFIDFTENMDTEPIGDLKNTTDLIENMDKNFIDLTENMDTEPIGDLKNTTDLIENMDIETLSAKETDDLIILSETLPTPVTVNCESEPVIGPETQELAEADTQPNDPNQFEKWEINKPILTSPNSNLPECLTIADNAITQSLSEAALILSDIGDTTETSSPYKDDNQKKQDFLNNTVEISPIKVQSPDRQKKSPSPETSRDFVVIQLSPPVHSNGETFDKPCSPEFFTEDKLSPDKQNASPPRVEETVTNSSPSASLSLKKNRPQVNRPSIGRAAHMLGLLSVNSKMNNETLCSKTCSLFNLKHTGNDCLIEQNAGTEENFLQLQRSLPTATSSPSGPILKRKFVENTDDSTVSPAKRKRVSFHDPPVSTTVSVHKYIDRRQMRSGVKSPRKLDNAFLDSALSKTVESFNEATTPSDETENISLDITPVVEIVKTSELNDTDPICPDLIDCTDPIDVIAIELSSAAMRDSFVKELEGKVDTVGDLAKMTELEVNRLCIKAPKITVAKKVLTDYITNRPAIAVETVIEEAFSEPMTETLLHESKVDVEMQTDEVQFSTKATQVAVEQVTSAETQTEVVVSANTAVQTVESGCKKTDEFIDFCMSKRDFFEKFKTLNDDQLESIAGLLSEANVPDVQLTFLRNLLLEKYETANLGSFCTDIMRAIFKPAR